mgnify:CR=1 FL=1
MPIGRKRSGKFVLRLDPALHHSLVERSVRNEKSLNSTCRELLERSLHPTENIVTSALGSACSERIHALQKTFGEHLLGVAVFGSVARDEATTASDLDLLIVIHSTIPLSRDLYRQWDAGSATKNPREITPHFVHLAAPETAGSIWLETAVDGHVVFDRNGLLNACLRKIRNYIIEGHATRRFAHGHPYWIRKAS